MTEKVGILVVSYGSRAAAIVDALTRSASYNVRVYDADKQRNPFIVARAEQHVLTGSDIEKICKFASKHKTEIDFGIACPENPIIDGVRDLVERATGIPMLCPTKACAIEGSKVEQRTLLSRCCPSSNPRFKVFDPSDYSDKNAVESDVRAWVSELDEQVVVKPDLPATGKGVGVWGDHFDGFEQMYRHFLSIFNEGTVLVEEKVEGEEFSLQFFSDGKHLVSTPAVRDYKRAFDNDLGPNTGGMGSYKAKGDWLPFMSRADWERAVEMGRKIFDELVRFPPEPQGDEARGIPMYIAFTCTSDGLKIFEINSRPGDPEIMNILPLLKGDFVDVCYDMLDGKLTRLELEPKASVLTYAVPMTYGGYRRKYSGSSRVDLSAAYELKERYGEKLRLYPGSMELRDDRSTHVLRSRALCAVGIDDQIELARELSLNVIKAIDGALWNRWDIASCSHIERSIANMKRLRGR